MAGLETGLAGLAVAETRTSSGAASSFAGRGNMSYFTELVGCWVFFLRMLQGFQRSGAARVFSCPFNASLNSLRCCLLMPSKAQDALERKEHAGGRRVVEKEKKRDWEERQNQGEVTFSLFLSAHTQSWL